MRTKVSEGKLALGILLMITSLTCAYFGIFDKPTPGKSTGFIMAGIMFGRFSILLFRSARQRISCFLKAVDYLMW